ncbi:MAG: fdrA domain protein [Dehalococcoidia bacterium]
MTERSSVSKLLTGKPVVVALGVRLFTTALEAQQVQVVHVEWRPAAGGDKEMLDLLTELL